MTLANLIRKREPATLANANPAKVANDGRAVREPLARLAALALANPKGEKTADAVTSWGWLLHFADREPMAVYFNPDAGFDEVMTDYPDALAAEPIPERTRREPTDAEAKELRALVQAIGRREGWTVADTEQATALALADVDAALACYRDIAADLGAILQPDDDRRTCDQCANLIARQCQAAKRSEIVASRDYESVRDLPRRCEGYAPAADDPDTRPGRERWIVFNNQQSRE